MSPVPPPALLAGEIQRVGRRLADGGLVAGRAGNVSARLDGRHIVISARGCRTGELLASDLVVVHLDDPCPPGRASTELPLHRAAYLARTDIEAVIHAHAPALTAAGLRGLDLVESLPELELAVGPIATVPFHPSGTDELGSAVGGAAGDGAAVVLLARHGVASFGRDLDEALDRLEMAELAARAVVLATG